MQRYATKGLYLYRFRTENNQKKQFLTIISNLKQKNYQDIQFYLRRSGKMHDAAHLHIFATVYRLNFCLIIFLKTEL